MSDQEIKPCPFCGGDAELGHIGNNHTQKREAAIKCSTIGCTCKITVGAIRKPIQWCEEEVLKVWNTRPSPDSELRELLGEAIGVLAKCEIIARRLAALQRAWGETTISIDFINRIVMDLSSRITAALNKGE